MMIAGLVRSVLDMSLSLGRAAGGVRGPLKAWRKKALQHIFEAGESLRLQFPLEDLGFTYSMHGAAVCLPHQATDDSDTPAGSAAQNLKSQQGRGMEYVQVNGRPHSESCLVTVRLACIPILHSLASHVVCDEPHHVLVLLCGLHAFSLYLPWLHVSASA